MHSVKFRRAAATVAFVTGSSLIAVGAAGPAIAGPAQQERAKRLNTSLSIAAPAMTAPNGRAQVSGGLTARGVPLADRRVRLLVKREGMRRWLLGPISSTDRRGRVDYTVTPRTETSYRLKYFGARHLQPTRSEIAVVAPRDTEVSIAATPQNLEPGGSTVISGVITDGEVPLVGATVSLLARETGTGERYALVATGMTAADGTVAFTDIPVRTTSYKLAVQETATSAAARSQRVIVAVKTATRIAVRARTIGDTFSVLGSLRSRGAGIPGRLVRLQSQAPGSEVWVDVKAKRTGRDGVVSFRKSSVEGTSYRLVFTGTDRLGASISRTVVA